jgi:hypothetical protein
MFLKFMMLNTFFLKKKSLRIKKITCKTLDKFFKKNITSKKALQREIVFDDDLIKNKSLRKKSNHHQTRSLFGEIVFDDDFCKILKLQNDVKEKDDFKNAKIYKIYEDLNNTRDVIYIGSTCDTN